MLLASIVPGNEHLQGLGLDAETDFTGLESYVHICAHIWIHVSSRQCRNVTKKEDQENIILAKAMKL